MSDLHPDVNALAALVLDDFDKPEREALLAHLNHCPSCRTEYDTLARTVEDILAVTPEVDPPPGFEDRTLAAMGVRAGDAPAATGARGRTVPWRTPRWRTTRWRLAAASVALGAVLGAGATYAAVQGISGSPGTQGDGAPPATTAAAGVLWTANGDRVGTVSRSYAHGVPVLVVSMTGGRPGASYECRLRVGDGRTVVVGDWTLSSQRPQTWVVDVPQQAPRAVELVAHGGDGPVWATARL